MKKILIFITLLVLLSPCFATTSPTSKTVLVSETVATCNSAALVSIPSNGYVEIFAQNKMYLSLAGVTPNTNYRYLTAGTSIDTQIFYYKGQKIGVLSDSGTTTYNIVVYKYENE